MAEDLNFRYKELNKLHAKVDACQGCNLCGPLKVQARTLWSGEINLRADLFLIGWKPQTIEATDLYKQRPFSTTEGELIQDALMHYELDERTYLTNLVQCPPYQDSAPTEEEVESCAPYLERQIELMKPKMIVTVGPEVTRILAGIEEGLTMVDLLNGPQLLYDRDPHSAPIPIYPIYSPKTFLKVREIGGFSFTNLKMVYNEQWRVIASTLHSF